MVKRLLLCVRLLSDSAVLCRFAQAHRPGTVPGEVARRRWRQRAAAEDGCDVSVGTLPPRQLLEEIVKLTNENYQMLVDQTPAPGPEAPHECTCGRCQ